MIETFLVPHGTVVAAKGDGATADISGAAHRVFLLTLQIKEVIEQESLDVSILGSGDGNTWTAKPLVSFPQKFYRGQHPLLLDLTSQPEVKFLRAHWEASRWGRGSETPRFEFDLALKEVPADVLRETAAGLGAKV
jgi:hypothetical protein